MHGIIFDIKRFAVHDGPGIRTTIFLKGCPLSCWWCHNPEGISPTPVCVPKTFRLNDKTYTEEELIGKEVSVEDLMNEIRKETIFTNESGGGVTFSGGEPLLQYQFLGEMLKACRNEGIHTAVDTTAFASWETIRTILPYTDLFLIDLKLMEKEEHIKYTGVSNELILENIQKLSAIGSKIRIRIPAIPDITLSDENIKKAIHFLQHLENKIEGIDLLPFHRTADQKYKRFGMQNRMREVQQMKEGELTFTKLQFEHAGFNVKIGG